MILMPNTTTPNEIQRSYRKVFNKAKKSGPVVVLTNNKPDVVILSSTDFDNMYKTQQEWELSNALKSIQIYKKEKKEGKLIEAKSLADLIQNNGY